MNLGSDNGCGFGSVSAVRSDSFTARSIVASVWKNRSNSSYDDVRRSSFGNSVALVTMYQGSGFSPPSRLSSL